MRDEDADKLHRLRERDPALDRLTLHIRKLAAMMTGRHGDRLEEWITDVEQDSLAPLTGFARNLRRDFDAVRNGLSLPHSSGAVEGNINRLKMLKRQMFGRAGLDLLRKPSCSHGERDRPDHKIVDRTRIFTWMASMKTTG
jgi:transposase